MFFNFIYCIYKFIHKIRMCIFCNDLYSLLKSWQCEILWDLVRFLWVQAAKQICISASIFRNYSKELNESTLTPCMLQPVLVKFRVHIICTTNSGCKVKWVCFIYSCMMNEKQQMMEKNPEKILLLFYTIMYIILIVYTIVCLYYFHF